MILYVNGDSHSAAGEAVNDFCFADDDPRYSNLGRQAHPDNLRVSYGYNIAQGKNLDLVCNAESASSNDRIIRTTTDWLDRNHEEVFVIIGWSTWEREEWLHDGVYWQVNAGGIGSDWPDEIKRRYKEWILTIIEDSCILEATAKIVKFRNELRRRRIPHLFFNTFEPLFETNMLDWGVNYINPYDKNSTYYNYLLAQGCKTTKRGGYHFGKDAHTIWAEYLIQYIDKHNMLG